MTPAQDAVQGRKPLPEGSGGVLPKHTSSFPLSCQERGTKGVRSVPRHSFYLKEA